MKKLSGLVALLSVLLSCGICLAQEYDECKVCEKKDSDFWKDPILSHPKRKEWICGGFYEGRLEDGTPFQMNLEYPIPQDIQRQRLRDSEFAYLFIGSSYWYPRKYTIKNSQRLEMELTKDFHFTINNESFETNEISEIFTGVFTSDKSSAEGTLTLLKRKKVMHFSMKRTFVYKAVVVTLPSRCKKHHQEGLERSFTASFPVIGNPKMDRRVREMASNPQGLITANNVQIAWLSKNSDQIAFHIKGYGYSEGAAHGGEDERYEFFTRKGGVYMLTELKEYMNLSTPCLEKVSKIVVSDLKKQGASAAENGAFTSNHGIPCALPTPLGINFNYCMYYVGSYTEGAYDVFVNREQLGNCLKYLPRYEAKEVKK